jgi:hypothetical protein
MIYYIWFTGLLQTATNKGCRVLVQFSLEQFECFLVNSFENHHRI